MSLTLFALVGALALSASPQTIPPPIIPQRPQPAPILPGFADLPVVTGALESPACGGFPGIAEIADCVSGQLNSIGDIAAPYLPLLTERGFVSTGGRDNQYTFERPRDDGTCDGLTITAIYDTTLSDGQLNEASGWLAFAAIGSGPCRNGATATAPGVQAPILTPDTLRPPPLPGQTAPSTEVPYTPN